MRLKKMRWSVVVAMTLGVLGVAAAEPDPDLAPPAAQARTARDVELGPALMNLARSYMSRMEQAAATVRSQFEAARAARDVVKTLCLNDKLNQLDVTKRSALDRVTSLQGAVNAKDKDRGRHEFMILQVLRDRVDQLVKEANQCIGEEAGFIGDTQVSLQVDPNIPNNDPAQLGFDPDTISEIPDTSSPTQ